MMYLGLDKIMFTEYNQSPLPTSQSSYERTVGDRKDLQGVDHIFFLSLSSALSDSTRGGANDQKA